MTDIIKLTGDKYECFETYLYNLYWSQSGKHCLSDMLVVWAPMYDCDLNQESIDEVPKYPHLFHADTDLYDDKGRFGWFTTDDDWCEGENWAVIHAVYMLDDLKYEPGIGFTGIPLTLTGRDDRKGNE